jgi:AcrR family transcriptional regulator
MMQVDKKEHIIQSATELFAEKGFEGTSVRELAAKAEVNLAMIHYYFGSKEGLFQAMVEHKTAYMKERIAEIQAHKTLSDIEKIDAIIESYVERFLSQPQFHKVIQQEMLVTKREEMHHKVIDTFIKNTNVFNSIIEKGMRKKVFRKVDPPMIFATIIGTINQVLMSKKLCNIFSGKEKDFNPYKDEHFKKRLVTHLKQIIHSHLLNS